MIFDRRRQMQRVRRLETMQSAKFRGTIDNPDVISMSSTGL
jgi:hypothetical protein